MNIGVLLLTKLQIYSDFTSFSTNVLFLFLDTIQDTTLDLIIMSPLLYGSFSVFPEVIFHDFDCFESTLSCLS